MSPRPSARCQLNEAGNPLVSRFLRQPSLASGPILHDATTSVRDPTGVQTLLIACAAMAGLARPASAIPTACRPPSIESTVGQNRIHRSPHAATTRRGLGSVRIHLRAVVHVPAGRLLGS